MARQYAIAGQGIGGLGLVIEWTQEIQPALSAAQAAAAKGAPVLIDALIDALIGRNELRKGFISL